jgi:hypothetical protein
MREFFWPIRRIFGLTRNPFIPELRASRSNFSLIKSSRKQPPATGGVQLSRIEASEPPRISWDGGQYPLQDVLTRRQLTLLANFDEEMASWASRHFREQVRQSKEFVRILARHSAIHIRKPLELPSETPDSDEQFIQSFAQLQRATLGIRALQTGGLSQYSLACAYVVLTSEAVALVLRTLRSSDSQWTTPTKEPLEIVRDCVRARGSELLTSDATDEARAFFKLLKPCE